MDAYTRTEIRTGATKDTFFVISKITASIIMNGKSPRAMATSFDMAIRFQLPRNEISKMVASLFRLKCEPIIRTTNDMSNICDIIENSRIFFNYMMAYNCISTTKNIIGI